MTRVVTSAVAALVVVSLAACDSNGVEPPTKVRRSAAVSASPGQQLPLQLRPVIAVESKDGDVLVKGSNPADVRDLASLVCADGSAAAPRAQVATCDANGAKFVLGPARWAGKVKSASVGDLYEGRNWAVSIDLGPVGAKALATLTRQAYDSGGQFAILIRGRVVSYGAVNEPINTGQVQIEGVTKAEAEALVAALT